MTSPELLDLFLPHWHVRSRHSVLVRAPAGQVWSELMRASFASSPLVRTLMRLRGYSSAQTGAAAGLEETLKQAGFVRLAVQPGEEIVFGLAGQFWRPSGCLEQLGSAAEFVAFSRPAFAKAAWNFAMFPAEDGATLLQTETRVLALSPAARRRFRFYWMAIAPFSGLLRREMLRHVRRAAENAPRRASTSA